MRKPILIASLCLVPAAAGAADLTELETRWLRTEDSQAYTRP